jgi:hypothetical protein
MALLPLALALSPCPPAPAQDDNSCIGCHNELDEAGLLPIRDWKESVHARAGVTCEQCHGGDASTWDVEESMSEAKGFLGVPSARQTVERCGGCHSDVARMRQYNLRTDQLALYKTSHHGEAVLKKGSEDAATCVDCHGNHLVLSPSDPKSPVHHRNVPETCARCHSDAALMARHSLPSDALAEYKESYHGTLLYRDNNPLVPNCATCHGTHGATPPGVGEVSHVCRQCHGNTADYYNKGPHAKALLTTGAPRCVDCHGNHRILFPSTALFTDPKGCASCHSGDKGARMAAALHDAFGGSEDFFERTEDLLKSASGRLIYLEPYFERMREAKSLLIEAGPVSHAMDMDAVRKITAEADAVVREVEEGIREKQHEIEVRRTAWFVVAAVAFGWMLLVALKLRQIPNPYGKDERPG